MSLNQTFLKNELNWVEASLVQEWHHFKETYKERSQPFQRNHYALS